MLWYFDKISEDKNSVIYAYGWNTKETSGQFFYDKTNNELSVLKIADNDTQKGAEWAMSHFPTLIKESFPDKRKILIG
jgi:hypothetical protein